MSPPVPPKPNPGFWIPQATDYFRQFDDLFDTGTRGRDTQRNGVAYFTALLLPSEERKSMENMAEKLPGIPEHRLRHFATYSPWDYRDVQIRMAQILGRTFASPQGVLALDDTGIPKQGRVSVGVGHQYMGVLGKVANGQDAVSLQYVLPDFTFYPNLSTFLLGMELYLPQEWVEEPKRRERAHIPEEVAFRTKWQIGLEFLDRARALKLPHRAVVGDSGFSAPEFRRELRKREEPYLLGLQPTHTWAQVGGKGKPIRLDQLAKSIPPERWVKIRWAEGSKGPLEMETTRLKGVMCEAGKPTEEEGWILFERRSNETKAYLAWKMNKLPLIDQLRVMRSRFPIEQSYQQMKEELGLDHFEGRSWRGWHHHVTMVGMAQGFLMFLRRHEEREAKKKGRTPRRLPSVPLVRKWLNTQVATRFVQRVVHEKDPEVRMGDALLMTQLFGLPVGVKNGEPYCPPLLEFPEV